MDIRELRYRLLLIGRALYLGIACGAAFGVTAWGVLLVGGVTSGGISAAGVLLAVAGTAVAGFIGGVIGGGISLVCGLALALSGADVLRRMHRVRLVTGSVAAAIPLAVAWHPDRSRPLVDYAPAAGIATVAAAAAVLLASRIVTAPPPPGVRRSEGAARGASKPPAAQPER